MWNKFSCASRPLSPQHNDRRKHHHVRTQKLYGTKSLWAHWAPISKPPDRTPGPIESRPTCPPSCRPPCPPSLTSSPFFVYSSIFSHLRKNFTPTLQVALVTNMRYMGYRVIEGHCQKSAKNGLAQWFSSRKFREVLIFWCLKRARWKKFPSFMVVPKWCVFQPDLVTVPLKGGS